MKNVCLYGSHSAYLTSIGIGASLGSAIHSPAWGISLGISILFLISFVFKKLKKQ